MYVQITGMHELGLQENHSGSFSNRNSLTLLACLAGHMHSWQARPYRLVRERERELLRGAQHSASACAGNNYTDHSTGWGTEGERGE